MAQLRRTISVKELKAHISEVLRELQQTGSEVIVTVNGRPVARTEALGEAVATVPVDGMGGEARGPLCYRLRGDFQDVKKVWEPEDPDAD